MSKQSECNVNSYNKGVSIRISCGVKPHIVKLPIFNEFYGKLKQIYEKLRSDQMDPKSALGGPKPISRTGGSLLKN